MAVSSITPHAELMRPQPRLWPASLSVEHYRRVLNESPFPHFLVNSCKVAGQVTTLALPLAFGGGYALSRFRFRGRGLFGMVLLGTQMLPAIMLAVPLYVTLSMFNLIDTHAALIVCYTTFALPFTTWMMRGFFDGLPKEIEECAQVDGCGRWRTLWSVVLPLSAPGLVAAAVLVFLLAWNEYLFAMLFINTEELKTFPVGITLFISRWRVDYGALMAASVTVSVPVAVLFLLLQRRFVAGLTAGAVRG
jgi:multiple sugar transport system permease protein